MCNNLLFSAQNESCECDDGYTGTVCEVMCDVECGRNGKCVEEEEEDRESGFMCECDDGYTGEFCDTITTTPGVCAVLSFSVSGEVF